MFSRNCEKYSDYNYAFHFLGKKPHHSPPPPPNPEQHYYNIFVLFKHIPYNKHNKGHGISLVSSKCKGRTTMFLKATPVIHTHTKKKVQGIQVCLVVLVRTLTTAVVQEAY